MGLLKTLLFILIFYYGFKVLSRIFGPLLFKYVTKKAAERFGGSYEQPRKEKAQKKEGEISLENIPDRKSSNSSVGEYVDFEEVD